MPAAARLASMTGEIKTHPFGWTKDEWQFSGNESFSVTQEMMDGFENNGYIMIRKFLTPEELRKVTVAVEHPDGVRSKAYQLSDGGPEGRLSMLSLWNQSGSDVTGMLARSRKSAETAANLLGGEVYHYHTKLMMKEPRTGGQFNWHQDYGYWYQNGCVFPHMLTSFVAIDKIDKGNGCLQILGGSHVAGRVDHASVGGQQGADLERVRQLQQMCPLKHVEMDPGDCLFFHCNLLHRSDANVSSRRRWALLTAYCRADNDPVRSHHHPCYTPLHLVPNDAIALCENISTLSGKDFMDPTADSTSKFEAKNQ